MEDGHDLKLQQYDRAKTGAPLGGTDAMLPAKNL